MCPKDGTLTEDKRPTFIGTGQPGSTVQVSGQSKAVTETVTIGPDGIWTAPSVIDLPDGKHPLTVDQATDGTVTSTVAMALSKDTFVWFVSPADGAVVAGPRPVFTGTGSPGATTIVRGAAGDATDPVRVQANGTWSAAAKLDLKPGPYGVTVTQTSLHAYIDESSDSIVFQVRA